MLDKRKVVIIGAGHVGSHVAMALCFQGTCDEIAFIDIDREKAVANCYDVADACLFLGSTTKIKVGDYEDCRMPILLSIQSVCLVNRDRQGLICSTIQSEC